MNPVSTLLTDLAACLCAKIEENGGPLTCFCGVLPGESAIADYAGDCDERCGMAWVRLASVYPASGVGVASETVGNCSVGLGLDIEVGILRCMEIPADGGPPEAASLLETTDLQMQDMLTMRQAISCCESLNSKDYMLREYTPSPILGGVVGGAWGVSVAL